MMANRPRVNYLWHTMGNQGQFIDKEFLIKVLAIFRTDMKDNLKKELKHVVEKIGSVAKKVNEKMDSVEKKVNDQGETMLIRMSGMRYDLERVKSEVGNFKRVFKDKFSSLEERVLALQLNKNMEQKEENKGPFPIDTTCVVTKDTF